MDSRNYPCSSRPIVFRRLSTHTCLPNSRELHGKIGLRMNINSSLAASATSLGPSGNPVTSSLKCPDSCTSFCMERSSFFHSKSRFRVVNGSSDFFQHPSQTSLNSCGKRSRKHLKICGSRPSSCVTSRISIQVSGPCDLAWQLSWVD